MAAWRGAPQALFCLLCLSLSVSIFWYTVSRGRPRHWRLRPETSANAAVAGAAAAAAAVADAAAAGGPGRQGGAAAPFAAGSCQGGAAAAAGVECASYRLFNDSDGEWRVCTAGPMMPRSPCLAFAIGSDLSFDAEFARAYSCQLFNFNSPEHGPVALGDGLWALGRLNDTGRGRGGGGGFRSLLRSLGATVHVVELLRLRLRRPGPDFRVLEDSMADGSLANVKQLLLQADQPVPPGLIEATVAGLAGASFCQWGQPARRSGSGAWRLALLNVRFTAAPAAALESQLQRRHRNPPGSQIARPLEKLGLAKPMKDE